MYKLGIVGFGVVGKSVLVFLNQHKITMAPCADSTFEHSEDPEWFRVSVWDKRALERDERDIANVYKAATFDATQISLDDFICAHDYVVVSPGVDIGLFKHHRDKILCELDFFSVFFNKPVIAITGSLGKTTITKLISKCINVTPCKISALLPAKSDSVGEPSQLRSVVGGNIGIAMLELCQRQDMYDLAVIELSSFQLEMSKKFSPAIAILTNVYENHLDRHKTLEEYFESKFNLFQFQREGQVAIFAATLLSGPLALLVHERIAHLKSDLYFFTVGLFNPSIFASLRRPRFGVFFVDDNVVCLAHCIDGNVTRIEKIFDVSVAPSITFLQNWVVIIATLRLLEADFKKLSDFFITAQEPLLSDHYHRLELCASIRGVDFYNDSKATVIQSTLAAVEKLAQQQRPIILILGGLSKGVDRTAGINFLKTVHGIKHIYYFGAQSDEFFGCTWFETLEQTIRAVANTMTPGDIVLFSPGGASFDFFKNYAERGDVFKKLVEKINH